MNRFPLPAWSALVLAVCLLPLRVLGTTVIAPDFDTLVRQSDYVVRATVKSVNAEWRSDSTGRHIITKVELSVTDAIKGTPPTPLVLELLGGKIGNLTMVVDGSPKFNVGDDDILFVHGNGHQFIPLVALGYGQYTVARDPASGQEFVLRSNGSPLYDVADVGSPMTPPTATGAAVHPVSASEFAGKIRASVSSHSTPPPANAN